LIDERGGGEREIASIPEAKKRRRRGGRGKKKKREKVALSTFH